MKDDTIEVRGFLANLGLYTEGELRGEWVDFPCDQDEFAEALKRIGVKEGVPGREEYFFTDWESDLSISDLAHYLGGNGGEYVGLDEVNALCERLEEAVRLHGKEEVLAIAEAYCLEDALDARDVVFYPDVKDDYGLGELYCYDLDDVPERLKSYIDYEKYGRDIRIEEGGAHTTWGYVVLM